MPDISNISASWWKGTAAQVTNSYDFSARVGHWDSAANTTAIKFRCATPASSVTIQFYWSERGGGNSSGVNTFNYAISTTFADANYVNANGTTAGAGSVQIPYNPQTQWLSATVSGNFSANTDYYLYLWSGMNSGVYNFIKLRAYIAPQSYPISGTYTALTAYTLTISAGANTSLTVNRTSSSYGGSTGNLSNNATLYPGDVLRITASASSGYQISTLKVNNSNFESGNTHTVSGNVTVTSTATLSTPKATAGGGTWTMGTSKNIVLSNTSSGCTYTIDYVFGNASGNIVTGTSNTTIGWNPSTNLGQQITTATQGTGTFTVTTKKGTTTIGSTTTSFTLQIPTSGRNPTVSSGWAAITTANQSPYTSLSVYIAGSAKITATIDRTKVSGNYGATIASTAVTAVFRNQTLTATGTFSNAILSGTNSVVFTATDSRGLSSSTTLTVTGVAYTPPSITVNDLFRSDSSGNRQDDGSYARVRATASIFSQGGNSISTFTVAINSVTTSLTSGTGKTINAGLNEGTTYSAVFTLKDRTNTTSTLTMTLAAAGVAFNIKEQGKGAAFGKFAEKDNVLDIGSWSAIGRVLGLGQAREAIPSAADLNSSTYYEFGVYGVTTNTVAASLSNCPSKLAGVLRVWNAIGNGTNPGGTYLYVIQEYIDYKGNVWIRHGESGSGTTVTYQNWVKAVRQNVLEDFNGYQAYANSNRLTTADQNIGDSAMTHFCATSSMTTNKPPDGDGHIIQLAWDNASPSWNNQIYIRDGQDAHMMLRGRNNSAWGAWKRVYTEDDVVPIADGGTGATTVAAARNALGLGNTSGAVPIANGGTGKTTAADALAALGGISKKLLWTNSSPTSSMAGQTIAISNVSTYSEFEVYFMLSTSTQYAEARFFLYNVQGRAQMAGTSNGYVRDVKFTSSGMVITTGTSSSYVIPYKIYGIKGLT